MKREAEAQEQKRREAASKIVLTMAAEPAPKRVRRFRG